MSSSASITGGIEITAAEKALRRARFQTEARAGVPDAPKRTFAHPEIIRTSDATAKLVSLARRRLASGHTLTEAQAAQLVDAGVDLEALSSDAEAVAATSSHIHVPQVYRDASVYTATAKAHGPTHPASTAAGKGKSKSKAKQKRTLKAAAGLKRARTRSASESGPAAGDGEGPADDVPFAPSATALSPAATAPARLRKIKRKLQRIAQLEAEFAAGKPLSDGNTKRIANKQLLLAELAACESVDGS